jgi:hypothetical protein
MSATPTALNLDRTSRPVSVFTIRHWLGFCLISPCVLFGIAVARVEFCAMVTTIPTCYYHGGPLPPGIYRLFVCLLHPDILAFYTDFMAYNLYGGQCFVHPHFLAVYTCSVLIVLLRVLGPGRIKTLLVTVGCASLIFMLVAVYAMFVLHLHGPMLSR